MESKKVKLSVPSNLIDELVAFAWDNKMKLLMSYTGGSDFFEDPKVIVVYLLDEDAGAKLAASRFAKYIQK
jgi:hypothetical protein